MLALLAWSDLSIGASGEIRHRVPLFISATDSARQGFVRVINRWAEADDLRLDAFDDSGRRFGGSITLSVEGNHALHFNSDDMELGNESKGLSNATGFGEGDWRQEFLSGVDAAVLAYIRTPDGFLTSMHDVAPMVGDQYRVAIFNPADNPNQVSWLRVINVGIDSANLTISGIDDAGNSPGSDVFTSLPAGAAALFSAAELERGSGRLDGELGDGDGKWQLGIDADQPLVVMSLLASPTAHLTNLSSIPSAAPDGVHHVPFFPSAARAAQQGFVRVINLSGSPGEVSITAIDDTGRDYAPLELRLNSRESVHFNSVDLESGNDEKSLTGSTGTGKGNWRLQLTSNLEIQVLSFVRTRDGFLTAMHDVAPANGDRYRVDTFNPASNRNQASNLRLINLGTADATVTVTGIDDHGNSPGSDVALSIPAGGARMLTASQLESGGNELQGNLGNGVGKWRLVVDSNQPMLVMSLLTSTTGHLTNLSTANPPLE